MKIDLIIHNASQLLTCRSDGKPKRGAAMQRVGIIENGGLAIDGGKIVGVGASDEISRNFQAKNIVDAAGKVVMPGFVDCHTHIVFAGNRLDEFELKLKGADYLEILEKGGGILSTVEKTRQTSLPEIVEQTEKRLDEMLKNGTLTAEVKTGYGLNLASEIKMLDAIAELDHRHAVDLIPTFLAAHALPMADFGLRISDLSESEKHRIADRYVDLICREMLPFAARWFQDSHFPLENTPFFCDVFCERNAFDLEQSRRVLETARSLGFKLKAHVDEFTNLGGARMAIELGATSIDHLDATSEDEIRLLAESETVAVVTPAVNFNFGSTRFADARKLVDAGCAVAVSTDYNPGSAPCPSLPLTLAIACRYQKLLPAEAINAATVNAAYAVGLGELVGSLETGKKADVLILDAADYRQIVYEFGANLVETVIKKGAVVFSK